MEITVLLPTYNSEKYISDAIKSILNQTHKNYEFLIIDDGSTDNTERIVKSFYDSRINYIKREHTGFSDTLNYGLKVAKYDWVARMDADDISHPNRLEKQISLIGKNQNTISFTWAASFKSNNIIYVLDSTKKSYELKKKLALHCYITHPSVLYNRNFILQNGGYNSKINAIADYELWLRIRNGAIFIVIPEFLTFIRIRANSLSRKNSKERRYDVLSIQNKYFPLNNKNNLFSQKEKEQILGWREYFYGSKLKARKYFESSKIFKSHRILLAYLITFLPESIFYKILYNRIWLQYSFILKKILRNKKIKECGKAFNKLKNNSLSE